MLAWVLALVLVLVLVLVSARASVLASAPLLVLLLLLVVESMMKATCRPRAESFAASREPCSLAAGASVVSHSARTRQETQGGLRPTVLTNSQLSATTGKECGEESVVCAA